MSDLAARVKDVAGMLIVPPMFLLVTAIPWLVVLNALAWSVLLNDAGWWYLAVLARVGGAVLGVATLGGTLIFFATWVRELFRLARGESPDAD
jgi:hypothetical protein